MQHTEVMAARARAHRDPSRWLPSLLPLLLGAGVCLGPAARISQAQTIIASPGTTGLATVVTDTTTTQPTSGSTVNYVITGGLPTTGNALIHSFAQFDLGPGTTATFDLTGGPSRITAIWGRILSGSQSSLQGTISVHSPLGNKFERAHRRRAVRRADRRAQQGTGEFSPHLPPHRLRRGKAGPCRQEAAKAASGSLLPTRS